MTRFGSPTPANRCTADLHHLQSQPHHPPALSSQPADTLVVDLLAAVAVELETPAEYDQDLFEVWSDDDGDGCDTRAEVLRDAVEAL